MQTIDRQSPPKPIADLIREFQILRANANRAWKGTYSASDAYWAAQTYAYGLCARMLEERLGEIRLYELEHPDG